LQNLPKPTDSKLFETVTTLILTYPYRDVLASRRRMLIVMLLIRS